MCTLQVRQSHHHRTHCYSTALRGMAAAETRVIVIEAAAADRRADSYSSFLDVSDPDLSIDFGESDYLLVDDIGAIANRQKNWQCDLYARQNWALLTSLFNVGLFQSFLTIPVTYYMISSRDISSAGLNAFKAATYLPWCFKLFAGIISDTTPILGRHRSPWFLIGWSIVAMANFALYLIETPSTESTCAWSFLASVGCVLADTIADAMLVEATSYEPKNSKGRMRIQAYIARGVGMSVGALMGARLHGTEMDWSISIRQCFLIQAIVPFVSIAPWFRSMHEMEYRGDKVLSVGEIFQVCWDFVATDAVWIPCFFLYLYNVCYIPNPAWQNYLIAGLDFSNFSVGMLSAVGAFVATLGVVAYDLFFFKERWKAFLMWTTLVGVFFSMLQLCLLYKFTFGLPAYLFALGDSSFQMTAQLMSFMPMAIMFIAVIPDGAEATTFALITTWLNLSSEIAGSIGTIVDCSFTRISNSQLKAGDVSGLVKLTWATSVAQLLPIVFALFRYRNVDFLPNGLREVRAQFDSDSKFWWGGLSFTLVLISSISLSTVLVLLMVVYPNCDALDFSPIGPG